MPTRDSGEQQHKSRSADDEQVEDAAAPATDLAARKEALDAGMKRILGYVQKPGEEYPPGPLPAVAGGPDAKAGN